MITLQEFVSRVDDIRQEAPRYRLGGSATDGSCDCIGLIIGAIRRAGGTWAGVHGSNYAARNEMETFGEITGETLEVGMIVYKAKEPGQSGYDLPSRYSSSDDKRDYYHVGVVISVDPLSIIHCTTPTVIIDYKLGTWRYGGRLKKIDYGSPVPEEETPVEMYVLTPNRGKVNMRKTAQTTGTLIDRIPCGAIVELIEEGLTWCKVKANGKTGYIMREYLQYEPFDVSPEADMDTNELVEKIEALLEEVSTLLQRIKKGAG